MGKDLRRRELGTGLSQRKDGRYQARYTDRFGNRKAIYGNDLNKLKKELTLLQAENFNLDSVKEDLTFDEWFEIWKNTYKLKSVKKTTLTEYDRVYKNNISPHVGQMKISSAKKFDMQRVIDKADDKGLKKGTQRNIKKVLNDMLSRAYEDDLIKKNPAKGAQIRSDAKKKIHALTQDEEKRFFKHIEKTSHNNLFRVAVNTGMRAGELFALQVADVDFKNNIITISKSADYTKYFDEEKSSVHINTPKTENSIRTIPINSTCKKYLLRQLERKKIISEKHPEQKNDLVFVTNRNTPIKPQTIDTLLNYYVERINKANPKKEPIKDFGMHVFRHTFATRCFEAGIDAKIVQHYLGHASIKTTLDLYTDVTTETSSADIEKIVFLNKGKIVNFKLAQ